MARPQLTMARRKKIRRLLAMMNRQNRRFIPVAPPLVEMMHLVTTDEEIDYLLAMGTDHFGKERAQQRSDLPPEEFATFFETLCRKGLLHVEEGPDGRRRYRLNAIAVGWYEAMMHYLMGRPEETAFSEKWKEFFLFFKKFNFFPLRNLQNLVMRPLLNPSQETALMNPAVKSGNRRKTIPVNTDLTSNSRAYPPSRWMNWSRSTERKTPSTLFPASAGTAKPSPTMAATSIFQRNPVWLSDRRPVPGQVSATAGRFPSKRPSKFSRRCAKRVLSTP
jgi:hypothetical protein